MESFRRIQWALRKARVPVSRGGLVLDVGAGACPYPRSDVLLERFASNVHRAGAGVVTDRPTVFADALQMPFKDKAFDFIIASHILEHIKAPERFLGELMRVGKAGYIEIPNIMLERLCAYDIHVLEIIDDRGKLRIHKKNGPGSDDFLARLRLTTDHPQWKKYFHSAPQMFHTRYFWRDRIEYEIDNPDESCDWVQDFDDSQAGEVTANYTGSGWRGWGLRALRSFYARQQRPVNWGALLACPACRGDLLADAGRLVCDACRLEYSGAPLPNFLNPQSL